MTSRSVIRVSACIGNFRNGVTLLKNQKPCLWLCPCRVLHPRTYHTTMIYAKGRDKPRHAGPKVIEVREDEIAEWINVQQMKIEMQKHLETLKNQFIKEVTVRTAAGAIETLPIMYEEKEYQIQDLAQINRKNPKVVVLNFSTFPQTIPTVLEAIQNSGMNLNPQQDGTNVYLQIPKVTKEHREALAKNAKSLFLRCKERILEVERAYIRKLEMKKDRGLSVEEFRNIQNQLQLIANHFVNQAEKMKNDKQEELLGNEK